MPDREPLLRGFDPATDAWMRPGRVREQAAFQGEPTNLPRLVDESGGRMIGTVITDGRFGIAVARRSLTSCRARQISLPGSKSRLMDARPGTDLERMTTSPCVPLRAS